MSITDHCDFCGSKEYDEVYKPIGTKRNARVCVCKKCGLVFSIHDDVPYSRAPNPSGDADWGNVRFCKGQRFDAVKGMLPTDAMHVLDVGSSRGHFVKWYQQQNPKAEITALEPDTRVTPEYGGRIISIGRRLEDAGLQSDHFDFVYCNQTLEHSDSAAAMLKEIYRIMAPGGRLFLEVPNLEVIDYPLNIEEFFIDKHNFHFARDVLFSFVQWAGLDPLEYNDDPLNVRLLLRKGMHKEGAFAPYYYQPLDSVAENTSLIVSYAAALQSNRAKLPAVVAKINRILATGMPVAFWGANTILDLLVKYGGLEPARVEMLVDTYIAGLHPDIHGVPIQHPDALRVFQPQAVIVLARHSSAEIVKDAQRFGVRSITQFADLLKGE